MHQRQKKEVRRLDLVTSGKVPSDSHVVFAPLPYATPTLQDAVDVLTKLKSDGGEERPKILFISDWSARVCNSCDADIKAIDAFYTILISAMKSLDGELMQNVTVVKQNDAILVDPSNYWISVINIGRYFMLDDVMGSNLKDSDGVGGVISRLMKIADVMGLEPTTIVGLSDSEDELVEMSLIQRYFTEVLNGSMNKPNITSISSTCLQLQKRESIAHKTDNDEYFILDDPKVHGKAKMKKAFCEPGNVDFCPPINLSFTFSPSSSVIIQRSPENGGDVTYDSKEQMEDDFKSEALHPGDLKAKASTIMVSVLDKITSGMKADPEASKAAKALKAFEKKMSKAKK
jgi:tyrosyl-tRNA synthetase